MTKKSRTSRQSQRSPLSFLDDFLDAQPLHSVRVAWLIFNIRQKNMRPSLTLIAVVLLSGCVAPDKPMKRTPSLSAPTAPKETKSAFIERMSKVKVIIADSEIIKLLGAPDEKSPD